MQQCKDWRRFPLEAVGLSKLSALGIACGLHDSEKKKLDLFPVAVADHQADAERRVRLGTEGHCSLGIGHASRAFLPAWVSPSCHPRPPHLYPKVGILTLACCP